MVRTLRAFIALSALLLLMPALAEAGGTISVSGDTLVFEGSPGADGINLYYQADRDEIGTSTIQTEDGNDGAGPSVAGPGCRSEDGAAYGSPGTLRFFCSAAGVTKVAFTGGGGDDRLVAQLGNKGFALTADMGDGNDRFYDDESGANIELGAGDDLVERGSKPARTLSGGAGDDDIYCSGDSSGGRTSGARTVDAGPGRDRVCGARGDDRLDGGADDDKIYGGDGDDVIDGDAGDDQIEGEDENDRITGGRGEDDIDGGAGRDDIRVFDREIDDVACGSKRDKVIADRRDDLSRCETVRLR